MQANADACAPLGLVMPNRLQPVRSPLTSTSTPATPMREEIPHRPERIRNGTPGCPCGVPALIRDIGAKHVRGVQLRLYLPDLHGDPRLRQGIGGRTR